MSANAGAAVTLVHCTGGRERLRVQGLYRNPAVKHALEARLAARPGIVSVRASVITGNVLVRFEARRYRRGVAGPLRRVVSQLSTPGSGAARAGGWHAAPASSVMRGLGVERAAGLSPAEARARRARAGANVLRQAHRRTSGEIFAAQFRSLPVALLGASAALSLATGGLADALVIGAVVLINAAIGLFTERSADRVIHGLSRSENARALVLRGGRPAAIDPVDVVPGDLLFLTPGTIVAADARLVESYDLTVDESALTGESLPVAKQVEALGARVPLAERCNMVYRATTVTGGNALAVVVATGAATEAGHIHALLGETAAPDTPLQKQLALLGRRLVGLSAPLCALLFLLGIVRGQGLVPALKAGIALFVAAVPEGLSAVATTLLALGVRDLRRDAILVRRLHAVEALGAVQTLCFDKTGTLTVNRMRAVEVATAGGELRIGERFACDSEELRRLVSLGVLCSDAEGSNGSATEGALLGLASAAGLDVDALRQARPKTDTMHRAEGRRWMLTMHRAGALRLAALKGSPEDILDLCTHGFMNGRERALSPAERRAIARQNTAMAGRALRVLGFAYKTLDDAETWDSARPSALVWVGLVGIADPLREGAAEVIARLYRAGVAPAMITGDQPHTAHAIGGQLGLEPAHVFARVTPAQKLDVVRSLQRAGRVVAMIGDGINDGPALRCAHVGIALGRAGTEVARSVADVVLEDDELASLLVAIRHGRATYDNLRKSIHFLLATNLSEVEVMLGCAALGLAPPLNPMQLLWLNLVSDIFPALALAMEPPEPDVLQRPPRDPAQPPAGRSDAARLALQASLISAGTLAVYGVGLVRYGPGPRAGSAAFMSLTSAQLLHAFSARSERHGLFRPDGLRPNGRLIAATGLSLGLQALAVFVPGLRRLLGVAPPTAFDLLASAAGAAAPFLANEALKLRSARR